MFVCMYVHINTHTPFLRYRSVTRSYYRGAIGCLLVYDITSRETYNNLVSWLTDARTLARSDITVCVVGNKSDMKGVREVTLLEASRFAQENGTCLCDFIFYSCVCRLVMPVVILVQSMYMYVCWCESALETCIFREIPKTGFRGRPII